MPKSHSKPKHEQPFWKLDAQGYSVFGHYHSHLDWMIMRNRIIDVIVEASSGQPAKILDVGCGKGWNIQEIADTVLARTHERPTLDIVEPDSFARNVTESLLVPLQYSGMLGCSFSDIRQVKSRKYDAILFMHSGYYIKDFDQEIKRLADGSLNHDGVIIVQTLPQDSAFFLNTTYLPNTTGDVLAAGNKVGHACAERFQSRFLGEVFDRYKTDDGIDLVKSFMDAREMTREEFMRKFLSFSDPTGSIDLRDDIVFITKEKSRACGFNAQPA